MVSQRDIVLLLNVLPTVVQTLIKILPAIHDRKQTELVAEIGITSRHTAVCVT